MRKLKNIDAQGEHELTYFKVLLEVLEDNLPHDAEEERKALISTAANVQLALRLRLITDRDRVIAERQGSMLKCCKLLLRSLELCERVKGDKSLALTLVNMLEELYFFYSNMGGKRKKEP